MPFVLHGSPFVIRVGGGLISIVGMESGKGKGVKKPFYFAVVIYRMNHELNRREFYSSFTYIIHHHQIFLQ